MNAKLRLSTHGKSLPREKEVPEGFDVDDFEKVVDMSFDEVEQFIVGCSPEQTEALTILAIHGPKVHGSLVSSHVQHLGNFNKSINEYLASLSDDEHIYLFAWDDWPSHADCVGFYALSATTHASLRAYFKLPPPSERVSSL